MGARISIHLPVYNGARTLERQLDSILNQSFSDFRLIITDNASDDRTEEICRTRQDQRLIYHRNHKNLGFEISYRRGLFQSLDSEFVVYASCNDYWAPTYLEACLAHLSENPQATLAYTRFTMFDESGAFDPKGYSGDSFNLLGLTPIQRFLTVVRELNVCTAFYGLMRTEAILQWIPAMNIPSAANDTLILAALAFSGPFIQIEEPLFFREQPQHFGLTHNERNLYMEKFNQARSYSPTFRFFSHLTAHIEIAKAFGLPPAELDRLIPIIVEYIAARYGEHIKTEISAAITHIKKGALHTGVSGESLAHVGQYKKMDFFKFMEMSAILNQIRFLLRGASDAPGLNLARAICAIHLGRQNEALAALKTELLHNPTDFETLSLAAKLEKTLKKA